MMDIERAQELMMSAEMVHVTYNDEKIYIEHVDRDEGLATIHPLDKPEEKLSVPVSELVEG